MGEAGREDKHVVYRNFKICMKIMFFFLKAGRARGVGGKNSQYSLFHFGEFFSDLVKAILSIPFLFFSLGGIDLIIFKHFQGKSF